MPALDLDDGRVLDGLKAIARDKLAWLDGLDGLMTDRQCVAGSRFTIAGIVTLH